MSKMRLKLLGVRGSRPTHKPALLGFGGNSTSMELILPDENFHLFIDGGSGLAQHSRLMERRGTKFHFLITHTHWDHILGLPFFNPLYEKGQEVNFYSSQTSKATFHDLFFGMQNAANMPVSNSHMQADIRFHTLEPEKSFEIVPGLVIKTFQINHQGVTLSYRIEHGDSSFAIVTDHAPIENGNYLGEGMKERSGRNQVQYEQSFNENFIKFLHGCNTVVFDTHFVDATLKPDWGHSTPRYAAKICSAAAVKRLILFHHAPEDTDDDVRKKRTDVLLTPECSPSLVVECAKEGDEWLLHSA